MFNQNIKSDIENKKVDTKKVSNKTSTKKGSKMKTENKINAEYITTTKAGKLSVQMINSDIVSAKIMDEIFNNLSTLKTSTGLKSATNELINNINIARIKLNKATYKADYLGFFNAVNKSPKDALLLLSLKAFKMAGMKVKYSSGKCITNTLGDTQINFDKHISNKSGNNNENTKSSKNNKSTDKKSVSDLAETKAKLDKKTKELSDFKKSVKSTDKNKDKIIADITRDKKAFMAEIKSVKALPKNDLKARYEMELLRVSKLEITAENIAKLSAIK